MKKIVIATLISTSILLQACDNDKTPKNNSVKSVESYIEKNSVNNQMDKNKTHSTSFVFKNSCATCHGANGEGGLGPKLQNKTADFIAYRIKFYQSGIDNNINFNMMKSIVENMPLDEVNSMAEYISENIKKKEGK